MYIHVYDPRRLIIFGSFISPTTRPDYESALGVYEHLAADAAATPSAYGTVVVFVAEGTVPPDAALRRRLSECESRLPRRRSVFITSSKIALMVNKGIEWISPSTPDARRCTCATYEEARSWLLANTSHSEEVLDALYDELCRRMEALHRDRRCG